MCLDVKSLALLQKCIRTASDYLKRSKSKVLKPVRMENDLTFYAPQKPVQNVIYFRVIRRETKSVTALDATIINSIAGQMAGNISHPKATTIHSLSPAETDRAYCSST